MPPPGSDPLLPLRANANVGAGRYLLQQHLGDGGMGSVWVAWDREVGKHYALKFLSLAAAQDPEHWARLRQEILRAQELRNEHIVGFFDLVVVPGEAPFLKMEYVPGRNLEEKRRQYSDGAMPWDKLSPLIPQLCDALEHAHERGIVHCDIKPSNLMVDGLGQLKLADFGIAQIADSRDDGPVFGTKAYMSPQRLSGSQPEPLDDLYAVGATFYELLTGEPPFVGENLTARILEEPAEALHERLRRRGITNEVPIRAAQIIMRCLDKDPAARPQNARDLSRLLSPSGGAARSKTKPPPPPLLPSPPTPLATPTRPRPADPDAVPDPPSQPPPQPLTLTRPDPGPDPEPSPAPSPPRPAPRPAPFPPDELWPVLFKVVGLAAALVAFAILAVNLASVGSTDGTLVVRALDRRQPESATDPTFAYWVSLESRTVRQGTLTNARPIELDLPPGNYRVEVAARRAPGESALREAGRSQTASIRRSVRTPVDFVFGDGAPPPTKGNLELVVTDREPAAPDPRTLFSYLIDRQGLELATGTAIHADPTTIELDPGEYRVRVFVSPESASGRPPRPTLTNTVRIAPPAKSRLELTFGPVTPATSSIAKAASPGKVDPPPPPPPRPSQPPEAGQDWVRIAPRPGGPAAARFVWLGKSGPGIWLAARETTRADFGAFASEHPIGRGIQLPGPDGWTLHEELDWQSPGFPQEDSHPAVGINWFEAAAFCEWLTARDRADGLLTDRQQYRLPHSGEFLHAARDLHPGPNTGNLAGLETRNNPDWPPEWSSLPGHEDPYVHTAPAGSGAFPTTSEGLADLIGNAAEWSLDWFTRDSNDTAVRSQSEFLARPVPPETFRIVNGGSWFGESAEDADPRVVFPFLPSHRHAFIGFRLALEDSRTSP